MGVQSACQRANQDFPPRLTTGSLSRPHCPHCGSVLLVAEESHFASAVANANSSELTGRIVHQWTCDDCGHVFVTSIRLYLR